MRLGKVPGGAERLPGRQRTVAMFAFMPRANHSSRAIQYRHRKGEEAKNNLQAVGLSRTAKGIILQRVWVYVRRSHFYVSGIKPYGCLKASSVTESAFSDCFLRGVIESGMARRA
jgi:pectin methylesterase-like acyl-CoA thioesterase